MSGLIGTRKLKRRGPDGIRVKNFGSARYSTQYVACNRKVLNLGSQHGRRKILTILQFFQPCLPTQRHRACTMPVMAAANVHGPVSARPRIDPPDFRFGTGRFRAHMLRKSNNQNIGLSPPQSGPVLVQHRPSPTSRRTPRPNRRACSPAFRHDRSASRPRRGPLSPRA